MRGRPAARPRVAGSHQPVSGGRPRPGVRDLLPGRTGITLPDTLETVGRNAFYTCRELREVRFANRALLSGDRLPSCAPRKTVPAPQKKLAARPKTP